MELVQSILAFKSYLQNGDDSRGYGARLKGTVWSNQLANPPMLLADGLDNAGPLTGKAIKRGTF